MVTTVTLNPMLDKTITVDGLRPGVTRASRVEAVVGGKGVNVARQLRRLGIPSLATGLRGGEIGEMLDRLLDEEGLPHAFFRIGGLTREGVTYRSRDGGITAVFEPAHPVTAGEAEAFVSWFTSRHLRGPSWIVCSGSSPSTTCDGVYRAILQAAAARGVKTVLDSYGAAFEQGLDSRPTLVKPNRHEFEQTFGTVVEGEAGSIKAVKHLLERAELVIMTDGAAPCYAGSASGIWRVAAPPLPAPVNPTGSGDSLVAATLTGLLRGWPFEEAVRFGAAAGAANASVWTVADSPPEEIERYLEGVAVRRVE